MAASTIKQKTIKTLRLIHGTREVVPAIYLPLGAVDTGGGVLSYQNPYNYDLIVTRLILDVTTKATAACAISAGVTSTNATTSSANLIDTLDVGTAAGIFDNVSNGGTLGKARQILPAGKWLTISRATGAAAGLVGNAIIHAIARS